MELKEYLKIIKQNIKLFLGVILVVIAGSFAYFIFRPVSFGTSLTLNITREGSQETPEYKFGDFYRLQADEKFAETVVEWLKSPRTVADIYSQAGINPKEFTLRQLTKLLKPEKLSSQIVTVNFSSANPESAGKISKSIFEIISQNTENLNKNQNEKTWFEVLAQDPVMLKEKFDPLVIFIISLAAGIFAAFWVVLAAHYLK